MAVMFKTKNVLANLGVDAALVAEVEALGLVVTFGINTLELKGKSGLGETLLYQTILPVSVDALLKATAPAVISKSAIGQLTYFIDNVVKDAKPKIKGLYASDYEIKPIVGTVATKALASAGMSALEISLAALETVYPSTTAKTAPSTLAKKIPLVKAQHIYQMVDGTSAKAKYVTVAVHDDFNVAVKLDGTSALSIRVEGNPSPAVRVALADQGITDKYGYFSGHFALNKVPPVRVLGAILFGLGVDFREVISGTAKLKELA